MKTLTAKNIRKNFLAFTFGVSFLNSFGQIHNGWTAKEEKYYKTLNSFCNYIESNANYSKNKDSLTRYIYFDYILKDTSNNRINDRFVKLDTLVVLFKHFVDSVGRNNLDAAPSRFYKNNSKFYKPFVEQLKNDVPNTFAYFSKKDPDNPLGYIWFDDKHHKIISWIMLDQGGTYYFLTFNLI